MQQLAHSRSRPNPAVVTYLEMLGHPEVELAVSVRDEMLHHLLRTHHGSIDVGLVGYFRTGRMAASILKDVVVWRFGDRDLEVLEFACGYGRVTRFLGALVPKAEVTAAEIDPDAIEFHKKMLGVPGFVTGASPHDFADRRFDAVFVASYFSHLPESRFEPWLKKLYGLLAPGGVLILSTHGVESLPSDRTLPTSGIHFEEVSESDRLAPSEYGSSWVSESFVAGLIERVSQGGSTYRCFRKALWNSQDLYVVVPEKDVDFSNLTLGGQLQGYLDACYLQDPSTLVLSGWAAGKGGRSRDLEVQVYVNGEIQARVKPDLSRPDTQPLLGAASEHAGFEVVVRSLREFGATDMLAVVLESGDVKDVAYAGTIEVIGLYLKTVSLAEENRQLRHERDSSRAECDGIRSALSRETHRVAELDRAVNQIGWQKHVFEQEIAAMRRSRFWKAREAWFRVTGRREDRAPDVKSGP